MKRVFIIHQWMAGADGDWRPWLKLELEKRGYEVFVPNMPDIDTPVIEKWVSHLARIVGTPDKDTYFIGHSIGCQAIMRYLEKVPGNERVGGAIFVAGWFNLDNLEDEETEKMAKPWIETPINFEKLKTVIPKSILIISDNDPFGKFEENKKRFREIGSRVTILPGAGHITTEDGFTELPIVLDELLKMVPIYSPKENRG